MKTMKEVRTTLAGHYESVRAKEGTMLVVRRSFFYTGGVTAEAFAKKVLKTLELSGVKAVLVSKREQWARWPKQSYWEAVVKPEVAAPKRRAKAPAEPPPFEATVKVTPIPASSKEWQKKTRVYFHHEGESVLSHFAARAARPVALYSAYLPKVAEALGVPFETARFRWSRKAGCGCGCSPGFICEETFGKTVFVTLSEAAPTTSGKLEEEAEASSRRVQLLRQLSA